MGLIDIQWNPSDRQLRQFGWISLALLPLVVWLWGGSVPATMTAGALGAAVAAVGTVRPRWLRYPFVGLSVIATPIGLVVGELAMLVVYFGVFLPMGLLFRLIGRDSLQLRSSRERTSYWDEKPRPTSLKSYFRQW